MLEISLNKIIKNFGFKNVLDELSMEVITGERIALIGPNGCGKTTIFKIISAIEKPNEGTLTIRNGATIGILSQMPPVVSDTETVFKLLTKGLDKILSSESKIRVIETKMEICNQDNLDSLLKEYAKSQQAFDVLGGYEYEQKINKVCTGFSISESMLKRSFNTLSGGEKTIVMLAALIISEPSILLLDEPTNHLDVKTLEWLEEYLISYKGTIIISSHDIYFLDKVSTKTILIDRGKEEIFHGNYSYFLKENEIRIMSIFEDFKNQQKLVEAMKASIKKLQEYGKCAYPGGEAFFKRAASIQKRLDKIEVLDRPDNKKDIPLDFKLKSRSGKDVLSVNNLSIILGDKVLFEDVNFMLKYGDKTCLMGPNGSGKSSFVKALLGKIKLLSGEIKIGSSVNIGYIAQEIKFDNESTTVLETVRKFYIGTESHLRATLSKFLFYGDDVFKKVSSLSGGERVRLKLLELIQNKANFLILDEPTNHIDIATKELLEEALREYNGTLLFISHNRYFINKLAAKTLNIEEQKIKEYLGNYDYFNSVNSKFK